MFALAALDGPQGRPKGLPAAKRGETEAGELQPQVEPTRVADLFAASLNDFSVQAAAEDRHSCLDCPGELFVCLDPDQIGRTLANLVGNAFKYTAKRGRIQASAWADAAAGRLHFSVQDDGEGIPDEYKSRVFDKFDQAPNDSGQPVCKGTGIGLTFCRLVVEAHGGRIWVEDAPGGGSDFRFWLPMKSNAKCVIRNA